MQAYAVSFSRYILSAAVIAYTALSCISLALPLGAKRVIEVLERICIAVFCLNAYLTLAILMRSTGFFIFGLIQLTVLLGGALVYRRVYKYANMQMFNHICMMLSIGLVIICRINFSKGIRQALIALAGLVFVLCFPALRDHMDLLQKFCYIYALIGIAALGGVLMLGAITNGSRLNISIFGFTLQPSEFVKILFLLFLAGALCEPLTKWQLLLLSMTAAVHVGILVASRDLGSAVIFYVTYISLLFLASGKWKYLWTGLAIGAVGAVACFFLFSHVRIRVQVFLNPWQFIDGSGYQITQSLFALSFGGLFGAGLTQGMPYSIPFVESDFIFSAVVEEMGLLTGICLLILCLQLFADFMHLAVSFVSRFYQLFVSGAAIAYLFQSFLTVGGEVKFIPLTGVTLPLVSYGGSSVLASLTMFGIVGTVFMLQGEQLERFRIRYEEEQRNRAQREKLYESAPPPREDNKAFAVPYYDPASDYEGTNHFDV